MLTAHLHYRFVKRYITLKKLNVAPPLLAPYLISPSSPLLARSSAFCIGLSVVSTVRNAARFAVYEFIRIKQKNHQDPASIRVDAPL